MQELLQLVQVVDVVQFALKLGTDQWFEHCPHETDKLGRVDQVQRFEILLVSETRKRHSLKIQGESLITFYPSICRP